MMSVEGARGKPVAASPAGPAPAVEAASAPAAPHDVVRLPAPLTSVVDARTLEILRRRRGMRVSRHRGWLVRRMLLTADLVGLAFAMLVSELTLDGGQRLSGRGLDLLIFAVALPGWVVLAKLYGLYDQDEERTDHSTVDEMVGVLNFVTLGAWLYFGIVLVVDASRVSGGQLLTFWGAALLAVVLGRSATRAFCRRRLTYLQNTVIVGAGDVGQLIARKFLQHPEYGINLVGFVDDRPKEPRQDIGGLTLLGPPGQLPEIVRELDVERVVVAYSNETPQQTVELVRSLNDLEVQIDVVPRLFDVVPPNGRMHNVEGLALIGLPPVRISRSSRMIKRSIDVVGALVGLLLTAPLFALIAFRIKRDSPGPVFFRQTRLGMGMCEFTVLKFRTMVDGADADPSSHLEYIKQTMDFRAAPTSNGLYKLDREDVVTRVGRWLRRTSLDELPQLVNVLRGDMSLVGPRPCIPYETQFFDAYHFERFLVPAGITGLWQVTARAHSTFGEALDLDVTYARGWSLGLDVTLLVRTFHQILARKGTT